MGLTIHDLYHLGQFTIETVEDPNNEIDIKPDVLNDLKREVTATKRISAEVPQDNTELNKIVSFFQRHKEIVAEVSQKPLINMDIEFTVRFIASNQRRINEILTGLSAG